MPDPFARPTDEQPSTLGGARRVIAWEAIDGAALDVRDRAVVGERWRARQEQEHLAVGAFAQLTWEVAASGGDPVVLAMLTRAASDEVRHAEICRRAAVAFLGEAAVPSRLSGTPRPPAYTGAAADRALLHVVEMCCLSETFTGVYLTEALAQTEHPTMRCVLESLLEDEIDHGRVGWAHLVNATTAGPDPRAALARVSAELPAMLERTIGRVLAGTTAEPEADIPARRAVGHIASRACTTLFKEALGNVILPGFEAAGVDVGPAIMKARAEGWC